MSKLRAMMSRLSWKWILAIVAMVGVIAYLGVRSWQKKQAALPEGIAAGNGRIESKEVDVATKLPLRVKEILAVEGDLVKPSQVLVRMDTITLEAELAEANQNVAAAREQISVAKAAMARRGSEIELAKIEKERSQNLVKERAGSQREYDVRTMTLETTRAGYAEEKARLGAAQEQVKAGEANVAMIQSRIDDATLRSPVLGRVLYRLAEPGEVLEAGGKVLTLINLEDVYMEIFLPSEQAAALKVGSEARFTVDYAPNQVAAGHVSFVSPEAQFTPKEVETRSEREKLMFRVKIQVPRELVMHYIERIKTGIRGVGYVKVEDSAEWPDRLNQNLVTPPPRREESEPAVPDEPEPKGRPPVSSSGKPAPESWSERPPRAPEAARKSRGAGTERSSRDSSMERSSEGE